MKKNKVLISVLAISLVINLISLLQIVRGIDSGKEKHSVAMSGPGIEEVNFKAGEELNSVSVLFKTAMNRNAVPVEFQPPLKYESKWLDDRRLELTLKDSLIPGKKYFVKTFTDTEDIQGMKVAGQFREFFSSPLKVEKAECSFNDGNRADIVINFNGKLDKNNLKKYLKVSGNNGRERDYRISSVKNNQFKLRVNTGDDDSLKIDIKPGLKADKAERPLGEGYTKNLILNKELSLVSISSTGRSFDPKFRISFNRSVSAESARKFLSISPKTAFTVNETYSDNTLEIRGDFEPRTSYTFSFKKGLTSIDKSLLKEDVEKTARSGDLKTGFSVMSKGPFYPAARKFKLPLRVVSLKKLNVTVTKVYPNNLVQFFVNGKYDAYKVGKEIFKQEVETGVAQNEDKKIYLDLTDAVGDKKGIYVVNIKGQSYWDYQKITVIRTELGMSLAKTEKDLQIWTMDLNSGRAAGKVNVTLLSYHNQEIANVVSDDQGLASIKLNNLAEKPHLIKLEKNGDVSYRGLSNSISLSAFDMDYRNYSTNSYQAHIFAERDICRPGESLDFSIILRDKFKKAAGGFPLEAVAKSVDGRVIFSKMLDIPSDGFLSQKINVSNDTRTGHYYFELKIPGKKAEEEEIIGSMRFLVNTYTPDTFKVKINKEDKTLTSAIIPIDVEAVYNFGGALPGGDVYFQCQYEKESYKSKNFKGYTFGDGSRNSKYWSKRLELNSEGKGNFVLDMNNGMKVAEISPGDLKLKPENIEGFGRLSISASVTDSTGQTVSTSSAVKHMASPYVIGISREKTDGDKAVFKWARVNAEDQETSSADVMKWTVLRKRWRYHYRKNANNDYVWDWQCEKTTIKEGEITESSGSGFLNAGVYKEGMYELVIEPPKGICRTVLSFDIGQSASEVRLGNSEFLKLYSDKKSYTEKDNAVIRFESPADGTALMRIAGSKLQKQLTYKVTKGWNSLKTEIPKTADGNIYAAVTLVRNLDRQLFLPPRFFGLINLKLDHPDNRLTVTIDAPAKIEPGQIVKTKIKVSGTSAASKVKLMAVDEGVLSLTAFKTPDPFKFFYGNRALKANFMDVFDEMFPEIKENFGTVSLAGGGGGAVFRGGNFDIVKSHALSLGIVETDSNGNAELEFTAPDFNGAMRIMAVAVNDDAVGHAEHELKVKDKVTIISGSVKALTPGDLVILPYTLFNNESGDLVGKVTVSTEGPVEIIRGSEKKLTLKPAAFINGEVQINAKKKFGRAAIMIEFKSGNIVSRRKLEFMVRPANARVSTGHSGKVESGDIKDLNVKDGFIEGTAKSTLIVSTSSGSEMYTYFEQLQQYPYGCLEQTTSRAVVNLYGSILSSGDREYSKQIVGAALDRLTLMQQYSGGFSMWPGGDEVWHSASVYAGHFIMECKNRGFKVDPLQLKKITEYLERFSENQTRSHINDRAYALYVLASLGKKTSNAALSILNDSDATIMAKTLACGALAREGKNAKAGEAFKKLQLSKVSENTNLWNMGTDVRRLALTALVAMDIFGINSKTEMLCEQLVKTVRNKKWMSTQDKAMVCVTIGQKAILQNESPDAEAVVSIGGKEVQVKSGKALIHNAVTAKSQAKITNSENGPVFYSYFASGIPEKAAGSESNGISLKREYLNMKDEKTRDFKVGELIKVRLKVTAEVDLDNTVILDLLPGCLAVESSMLKSRSGSTEVKNGKIKHYEGLDDRMVVCADLKGGKTLEFIYTARVVATGHFKICGLSAEGMYRPELRASVNENEILKIAKKN